VLAGLAPTLRVLLVDHLLDERLMYGELFRCHGFSTLHAETGAEAYALAQELAPDVVVTDFWLVTHGDGVDLTRRIKASSRTAALPVIMVSACAFPQDRAAAAGAGCDLFLPKPCPPDELVRAVERVLSASSAYRGADPALDAPGVP
jgi:two-component system cell cycle response regulator DivK